MAGIGEDANAESTAECCILITSANFPASGKPRKMVAKDYSDGVATSSRRASSSSKRRLLC